MIEIQNVTVYKCEHCGYTDTVIGRMRSHETECLSKQLKTAKNKDKQEIYNILDIDLINIKIKEFLEKYNLPVSTGIEFAKIHIDNSFLPVLELDASIRSVFDRTKFGLHNELSNLRYSKEHLSKEVLTVLEYFDNNIIEQKELMDNLNSCKAAKIKLAVKDYLKSKGKR